MHTIKRRVLLVLAPAVAGLAFAVAPALAQASPAFYDNATLVGASPGVSVTGATPAGAPLTLNDSALGVTVQCADSFSGHVWNTSGVGYGSVTSATFSSCADTSEPACSVTVVTDSGYLTWSLELASTTVLDINGVGVDVSLSGGSCDYDGVTLLYEGDLTPTVTNGSGSTASYLTFTDSTGTLYEGDFGTTANVTGKINVTNASGSLLTVA
jgi:hypothetical protein